MGRGHVRECELWEGAGTVANDLEADAWLTAAGGGAVAYDGAEVAAPRDCERGTPPEADEATAALVGDGGGGRSPVDDRGGAGPRDEGGTTAPREGGGRDGATTAPVDEGGVTAPVAAMTEAELFPVMTWPRVMEAWLDAVKLALAPVETGHAP